MDLKKSQSLVEELLRIAGFQIDAITLEAKAPGEYFMNISTKSDPVVMIGRRGEVLIALQHLIKNMLRSKGELEDGQHLKVDVDSYRLTQEKNVLSLADRMAKEVLENGRQAVMPPMSSFFRRMVHLHVKEKYPDLTTFSQGTANFRAVTISSAGATPGEEMGEEIYDELSSV
jgi:spoIIIJ-associated protein